MDNDKRSKEYSTKIGKIGLVGHGKDPGSTYMSLVTNMHKMFVAENRKKQQDEKISIPIESLTTAEQHKLLQDAVKEIASGAATQTFTIDTVPSIPSEVSFGPITLLMREMNDIVSEQENESCYNGYPVYNLPPASEDGKFYFIPGYEGTKGTHAPIPVIVQHRPDDFDGNHIAEMLCNSRPTFFPCDSPDYLDNPENNAAPGQDRQKFKYNRKTGRMEMEVSFRPKRNKKSNNKKGGKRR